MKIRKVSPKRNNCNFCLDHYFTGKDLWEIEGNRIVITVCTGCMDKIKAEAK